MMTVIETTDRNKEKLKLTQKAMITAKSIDQKKLLHNVEGLEASGLYWRAKSQLEAVCDMPVGWSALQKGVLARHRQFELYSFETRKLKDAK